MANATSTATKAARTSDQNAMPDGAKSRAAAHRKHADGHRIEILGGAGAIEIAPFRRTAGVALAQSYDFDHDILGLGRDHQE